MRCIMGHNGHRSRRSFSIWAERGGGGLGKHLLCLISILDFLVVNALIITYKTKLS